MKYIFSPYYWDKKLQQKRKKKKHKMIFLTLNYLAYRIIIFFFSVSFDCILLYDFRFTAGEWKSLSICSLEIEGKIDGRFLWLSELFTLFWKKPALLPLKFFISQLFLSLQSLLRLSFHPYFHDPSHAPQSLRFSHFEHFLTAQKLEHCIILSISWSRFAISAGIIRKIET